MSSDEELRRVFDAYDTDKSGSLDAAEVEAALKQLGLSHDASSDVFRRLDANGDGVISFPEFEAAAEAMRGELEAIFRFIDADNSGTVSEAELRDAMRRLRLQVDDEAVRSLFKEMDRDGNGLIDFGEFRALFALARPVDLLRRYQKHEDASLMADLQALTKKSGAAVSFPTSTMSATQQELTRMLMGGVSAVLAQLCVQPIETVKVRVQNATPGSGGFGKQMAQLVRNESALSLWKGTVPASFREMSYSTLRFGLYSPIKRLVYDGPGKEPLWSKIVSGGLAGGIGSAVATPLDLLKTRAQASAVPLGTMAIVRDVVAREGLAGLYKGMQTTVSRAVVIGSVKLATYDEVKHVLQHQLGMAPGSGELIVAAAVATGMLVSLTSAPIDFARTRLMR